MPTNRNNAARAKEAQTLKQRRNDQHNQTNEIISALEISSKGYRDALDKVTLLESVSQGLYEELDKLNKKDPNGIISDLALTQVNDVIRESKELVIDDPFVQRLVEFVAAGDNPEYRDTVLAIRSIRQGLERFRNKLVDTIKYQNSRLREANIVRDALNAFLKGKLPVSADTWESSREANSWTTGSGFTKNFDFEKLDETDIQAHFGKAK